MASELPGLLPADHDVASTPWFDSDKNFEATIEKMGTEQDVVEAHMKEAHAALDAHNASLVGARAAVRADLDAAGRQWRAVAAQAARVAGDAAAAAECVLAGVAGVAETRRHAAGVQERAGTAAFSSGETAEILATIGKKLEENGGACDEGAQKLRALAVDLTNAARDTEMVVNSLLAIAASAAGDGCAAGPAARWLGVGKQLAAARRDADDAINTIKGCVDSVAITRRHAGSLAAGLVPFEYKRFPRTPDADGRPSYAGGDFAAVLGKIGGKLARDCDECAECVQKLLAAAARFSGAVDAAGALAADLAAAADPALPK